MDVSIAAEWGVAGAVTADLVALSVDISANGYRWPWRDRRYQLYPRLVVTLLGILIAAFLVVAAHAVIHYSLFAFGLGFVGPAFLRRTVVSFRRAEIRVSKQAAKIRETQIEAEAELIAEARVAEPDNLQGLSPYLADTLDARRTDLIRELRTASDQPGKEQEVS